MRGTEGQGEGRPSSLAPHLSTPSKLAAGISSDKHGFNNIGELSRQIKSLLSLCKNLEKLSGWIGDCNHNDYIILSSTRNWRQKANTIDYKGTFVDILILLALVDIGQCSKLSRA